VLTGIALKRQPTLELFRSYSGTSPSGPLNAGKAYAAIIHSLVHSLLVLGVALVLVILAHRRPQIAGAAALVLTVLDLVAANARGGFRALTGAGHDRGECS
jgi:hypothetical protein